MTRIDDDIVERIMCCIFLFFALLTVAIVTYGWLVMFGIF